MVLPTLRESGAHFSDYEGITVMAGEAEGHTSVILLGGGDNWVVAVAADAWIAVGPSSSRPGAVQIGPHIPN
jgi:hypothetical protein